MIAARVGRQTEASSVTLSSGETVSAAAGEDGQGVDGGDGYSGGGSYGRYSGGTGGRGGEGAGAAPARGRTCPNTSSGKVLQFLHGYSQYSGYSIF